MTNKKFLQWAVSICSVALLGAVLFAVLQDVYYARFPRLEGFLGISNGRLEALILVVLAAAIATFVVFLFGATRGTLEFKAIGISLTGPSGPALLWIVVFVAVIAATNYTINSGILPKGESKERTGLETCFLEPDCRVAVHLATQRLDLTNFTPKPGIERFDVEVCSNARFQHETIGVSRRQIAYKTKTVIQDRGLRGCVVSRDVTCGNVVNLEVSESYTLSECTRFSNFGAYQFIGFLEK